jgi:tripeptide aminopeptidase
MNQRLIDSFMDLVRIDSESGNEQAFLSQLKQVLERELGGRCQIDGYGNLFARFETRARASSEPIVLASHADTVKPGCHIEPVQENDLIRPKGTTILGGDNKAGIAEIIEALRSAPKRPPVEWVITREEEIGLLGAKNFDSSTLEGKIGFLLDTDEINRLIIGGPTHIKLDVEVTGRGAHSGMEPEKGISAIQAAAHSISQMKLGKLDEESTANVGKISGGTVRNAIPEKAFITAECRSLSHEKCLRQAEGMKNLFEEGARVYGASADVRTTLSYRAMRVPEGAQPVLIARKAMERCGLVPRIEMMMGGTDAAIFNEKGIQMVVMGMGVRRPHTVEEHVNIQEMEKMVEVLQAIFADLCE